MSPSLDKNPDAKFVHNRAGVTSGIKAEKDWVTSIAQQPQTLERQLFILGPEDNLSSPGTARATTAPSKEHPNGTTDNGWVDRHQHQTVIQQHCDYFDPDHDGVIWPGDTYRGFRGFGEYTTFTGSVLIVVLKPEHPITSSLQGGVSRSPSLQLSSSISVSPIPLSQASYLILSFASISPACTRPNMAATA